MTGESRVNLPAGVAVLAGMTLVLAGAAATYLALRGGATVTGDLASPLPVRKPPANATVTLSPEAVARAGIVVAPVTYATIRTEIRLPGVVEPNAYRQAAVTPLVAGRVTHVSAQLGDHVRQGETMAAIYSPELADARTRYVAARAMLQAHDRELQRTQKLVEIGAASRQELERLHAEHATQLAEVESARSRLQLLGASASGDESTAPGADGSATIRVPAPRDGVVTERLVNVGVNVDASTKLFAVVDLSTVWVVANLYEQDFARVRVGSAATVTTSAYPDVVVEGRVSYIDPQVSLQTRTAKVRVEVPNPRGELRLGMYADVSIAGTGRAPTLAVPQGAVQRVGDRTVVYLANTRNRGEFVEREVRLGAASGGLVEVRSGLHAGEAIVTEGSFLVRAERERLGAGE